MRTPDIEKEKFALKKYVAKQDYALHREGKYVYRPLVIIDRKFLFPMHDINRLIRAYKRLDESNKINLWRMTCSLFFVLFWSDLCCFEADKFMLGGYSFCFILLSLPGFFKEREISAECSWSKIKEKPGNVKKFLDGIFCNDNIESCQQDFIKLNVVEQQEVINFINLFQLEKKYGIPNFFMMVLLLGFLIGHSLTSLFADEADFGEAASLFIFLPTTLLYILALTIIVPAFNRGIGKLNNMLLMLYRIKRDNYGEHCLRSYFAGNLTVERLREACRGLNDNEKKHLVAAKENIKAQYYTNVWLQSLLMVCPAVLAVLFCSKIPIIGMGILSYLRGIEGEIDVLSSPKILYSAFSAGVGAALFRFFSAKVRYRHQCQEVDNLVKLSTPRGCGSNTVSR